MATVRANSDSSPPTHKQSSKTRQQKPAGAKETQSQMALESIGEIIGPMPVDEFLKEFATVTIPQNAKRPSFSADHFKGVPSATRTSKKGSGKGVGQPARPATDDVFGSVHQLGRGGPAGVTGDTVDPDESQEDEGSVKEFSYEEGSEETPEQKATRALERAMYQPLIDCIREFMPNFEIVDSSNNPDDQSAPGKKWKPDLLAYLKAIFATLNGKLTQFDKFSLAFEIKTVLSAKPFKDPPKGQKPPKTYTFTPNNDNATLIRGQLMTVLAEQLSRQPMTHGFMVFIGDPEARLIFVDRGAIIITEAIPFRENPEPLLEFFWRFNFMTPAQRGIDQTVHFDCSNDLDVQAAAEQLAEAKLKQGKNKTVMPRQRKDEPIVVIDVPDSSNPENPMAIRRVVSCGTMRDPQSVTGRGTRTSIVWDLKANKPCFLKDSWRSLAAGMEKESDIIRKLAEKKVPNIPKLIDGDDVQGPNQTTRSQSFLGKDWVLSKPAKLDARRHHRLLEDVIPKFVEQFTTGRHLMGVMYDALRAHQGAYLNCGILHRDISDNNIMIDENDRGILTDWELAIQVRDVESGKDIVTHSRQRYRTGTWAFMSWRQLRKQGHVHGLADDLESIFFVVLYLTLHYFPVDLGTDIPTKIRTLFDEALWDPYVGRYSGGAYKLALFSGDELSTLEIPGYEPLKMWIQNIAAALWGSDPPHPIATTEDPQVKNHDYFAAMFKNTIASGDWEEGGERPTKRKDRTGKAHPNHAKPYKRSTDDGGEYKPRAEPNVKKQRKSASDHGQRARNDKSSQADAGPSGSRG